MTKDVQTWLTEVRRLDPVLIEAMGVGRKDHPGIQGEAVAFPYRRHGKPYAAKFRSVEGKDWRSSQGVSRGLYNEDALRSGKSPIVITEGEIDCLSVVQSGFDRAVSLPDGWTKDDGKREAIIEAEKLLRDSPYVIVAGDDDEAGHGLPKTIANILAGHDVRRVQWPEGCKDANDVLVKFGEGEVARCLTEAVRVDPPGGFVTGISDMPPLPERRVLRTGMSPYDFVIAFEVGAMSVGTGTPGAGKSTFTNFIAYHVARHENIKVGIMAFETHPFQVRDQLARLHAGTPWDQMTVHHKRQTAAELDEFFKVVHRTYEDDENPHGHNLGWLKDMIYTLAVRDGCKLIIVDPWNELEHMPAPGESLTNYINFALQQIRTWAEKFDTHICVIAHPRKMQTVGKPQSPTGYDIADSAAFANKPSLGFSVHQEEDECGDQYVRITAWKVRNTQLYGFAKSSTRLTFMPELMSYRKYESNAAFKPKKGAN
ncbi:bifunctional DNA primase/helicase [Tropicimonas sp. IMCC34011]|uniref:bifunctional DNA primase/helicase n=1 Tax=Tropicimonas sp. IMCC34011 TaxID=2248759 RepID=UPI000E269D9C|nr:bifunctional DNA primase/helicase [Tropicimonas sp. IMCC34011]